MRTSFIQKKKLNQRSTFYLVLNNIFRLNCIINTSLKFRYTLVVTNRGLLQFSIEWSVQRSVGSVVKILSQRRAWSHWDRQPSLPQRGSHSQVVKQLISRNGQSFSQVDRKPKATMQLSWRLNHEAKGHEIVSSIWWLQSVEQVLVQRMVSNILQISLQ